MSARTRMTVEETQSYSSSMAMLFVSQACSCAALSGLACETADEGGQGNTVADRRGGPCVALSP